MSETLKDMKYALQTDPWIWLAIALVAYALWSDYVDNSIFLIGIAFGLILQLINRD